MRIILSNAFWAFMKGLFHMKNGPFEAKVIRWAFTIFLTVFFLSGAIASAVWTYRYVFDRGF